MTKMRAPRRGWQRLAILMTLLGLLVANVAFADEYALYGGLMDAQTMKAGEYYYQEVTFLSGKPIVMTGKVTIPTTPTGDSYKLQIKYAVANTKEKARLERTVIYNVTKTLNNSTKQVITNYTMPIDGLKETATIGSDTFTLTSFKFSRSVVQTQHPGIRFDTGNLYFEKVFHVNGDETTAARKVIITADGKPDMGFENFWSSTATRVIRQTIASQSTDTSTTTGNWEGTVDLKFSSNVISTLSYQNNDVVHISFRGGLLKTTNKEVVMNYKYDLPGTAGKRTKGEATLNTYNFSSSTRLPAPVYKDLGDHWAAQDCFKMGSLEAFDTAAFFFPNEYVTREQFARALINTITYVKPETAAEMQAAKVKLTRPNAEKLPFTDISRDNPYYIYVERAFKDGLMQGEGNGQFLPTRPLHREEAITLMIRALGIDGVAPAQPVDTEFVDDFKISSWAKDAVYMAKEVGLVAGISGNRVEPQRLMTRAEAAVMLSRLIKHFQVNVPKDYRDELLKSY